MREERDPQEFDVVAEQYNTWVYPRPFPDLDEAIQQGWTEPSDPAWLHTAYWPDRDAPGHLDILVAGCGTNQAAHIAYTNPDANVVGIDLSAASLRHEQFLKDKHQLENLSLYEMDLQEIGSLAQTFDFIMATGVLHHLKDPARGLQALRSVMRPEAVLDLMLYSKYSRLGVYMMQELFRNLGLDQDGESVAVVRSTLSLLPEAHPVMPYLDAAIDLDYDSGLIDTFLHQQDRAYTVRESLDLLDACDLQLQGWRDNLFYYPEAFLSEDHPLFARLSRLTEPKIWECMELLGVNLGPHYFFACRKDRPRDSYAINWDGADLLQHVPVQKLGIEIQAPETPENPMPQLRRLDRPETPLSASELRLFECMDGQGHLLACLERSGLEGDPDALQQFAQRCMQKLWRMGHILLQKPWSARSSPG